MVVERICRLRVISVPLHARDNRLYDRIGELFGRVVSPSEFLWEDDDNSDGTTHVLLPPGKRVTEKTNLMCKGVTYDILVAEESSQWLQECEPLVTSEHDTELGDVAWGSIESFGDPVIF
ncbi:hypothetical protein Hanom_Chr16g01464301 [Helianthus anomalus]